MAEYISPNVNTLQICCITFNGSDLIRLITFPPQMIPVIRKAIQEGWSLPIQRELEYNGTFEFKLKGNPWNASGEEDVMARRLIASILKAMARYGWNLSSAADNPLSQFGFDSNKLFFENAIPDPTCQIFSITVKMPQWIRVVDAPEMVPHVRNAVTAHWKLGIEEEREYFGTTELQLKGHSWFSCPSESETEVYSRLVMAQVNANLKANGFKLYGSMGLNDDSEYFPLNLDTLFFRKIGSTWQ